MKKVFRRAISLVLALATLVSVTAPTAFAVGESAPLQIGSAAELVAFADRLTAEPALSAVLTADIELAGAALAPMGSGSAPYAGTFDGGGFAIRGIAVTASAAGAGLFGKVTGTVKNLTVAGNVTASGNYAGGVVGWLAGGKIERCKSEVSLTNTRAAKDGLGGICGYLTDGGSVRYSENSGTITGATASSGTKTVGGVVGILANGSVYGCVNSGTVTGAAGSLATTVGGVCGKIMPSGAAGKAELISCYNIGSIGAESTNSTVSGVVGATAMTSSQAAATVTIIGSYNAGTLAGAKSDGFCANQTANGILQLANNFAAAGEGAAFVSALNAENSFGVIPEKEAKFVLGKKTPILAFEAPTEPDVAVSAVSLSGIAKAGETLTASATGAGGAPATNVSFSWQRIKAGSVTDLACSAESIALTEDDVGGTVRVTASGFEASVATAESGVIERSDSASVAAAKAALVILEAQDGKVKVNALTLPIGAEGCKLAWTSSAPEVISKTGAVTRPQSGFAAVRLTAEISCGRQQDCKIFELYVYSDAAIDEDLADAAYLEGAKKALADSYFTPTPIFGVHENANTVVSEKLAALGYSDIAVSISESGDPAHIAADGRITYFYLDPKTSGVGLWFAPVSVTYALSRGRAVTTYKKQTNIYWDAARVKTIMKSDVFDKITESSILTAPDSSSGVTRDFALPERIAGAMYTKITWQSDHPEIFEIVKKKAGDGDYFPGFAVNVKHPETDVTVTLTARGDFQRCSANEPEIIGEKSFSLTVKALSTDEQKAQMQAALDANYTLQKLTVFGENTPLDADAVMNDIQLPTPAKTGIADYNSYRFTASGESDALSVSGYRAAVLRPLCGKADKNVTLTVKMEHKKSGIFVTKTLPLTLKALQSDELSDELALMEKAKAGYGAGILGGQSEAGVSANLSSFCEIQRDGEGIKFVRDARLASGKGIEPCALAGSENTEAWRLFRSSRSDIISHENLLLTAPTYDTAVTVYSCLSSARFARYAEKYPENTDFAKLNRQEVSKTFTVSGKEGAGGNEEKLLSVNFAILGDAAHGGTSSGHAPALWLREMGVTATAGETVFDLFTRQISRAGMSFVGSSGYISSITSRAGVTLAGGTNGAKSGWMYRVNGVDGTVGVGACYLKNGDSVEFYYTDDYTEKPEGGGSSGGTTTLPEISGADGTVSVSPLVTVKDGCATLELSAALAKALIEKAEKIGAKEILLAPATGGAESLGLVFSSGFAEALSKAGIALSAGLPQVKLTISAQALSTFPQGLTLKKTESGAEVFAGENQSGPRAFSKTAANAAITLRFSCISSDSIARVTDEGGSRILPFAIVRDGNISVTLMGAGAVSLTTKTPNFADISNHWCAPAARFVSARELLQGTGKNCFSPDSGTTRSEAVTVLYRLMGGKKVSSTTGGFSDVEKGAWYEDAVNWARENAVAGGTGEGRFSPNEPITREQLAVMVYALFGEKPTKILADNDISPFALEAFSWAVESGIITGRADGNAPRAGASRAELATILQRIILSCGEKSLQF